jgi:hypothetical protein
MHLNTKRLVALLAAWPLAAAAQTAPPRPDPLDAKAAAASLSYRSSLADYRRSATDPAPLDWREANAQVERIGGWRAYAREANAPEPAASATVPSAPRASHPAPPAPAHRH